MDCPSEERIIRLKLEGLPGIGHLSFDLEKRELTVDHLQDDPEILRRLESLKMGTEKIETHLVNDSDFQNYIATKDEKTQRLILWWVLLINAVFFLVELIAGFLSGSMGLVADSLDMLADAMVYGMSLLVVGSALGRKRQVASFAGYVQLLLAAAGFFEVLRRVLVADEPPDFRTMILVSLFALIANIVCLYLLQRAKSHEIHMKASMLFTSNDIIINSGVILAGVLVFLTQSLYPDLVVGAIVFVIVLRGGIRILRLRKA